MARYRIARGPASTEQLVEAGAYGYARSCVTSDNFPTAEARRPLPAGPPLRVRRAGRGPGAR